MGDLESTQYAGASQGDLLTAAESSKKECLQHRAIPPWSPTGVLNGPKTA
jgi:hypothetical protein